MKAAHVKEFVMNTRKIRLYTGLLLAMAGLGARSFGADVAAGRAAFRQTCVVCHTAEAGDGGGAQGPSLYGVFGRAAAANSKFTYTQALSASHLTWDAATLNRFLASPTTVVPGSAMVIAVPDNAQREDIVAYFQSLQGLMEAAQAAPLKGDADWKKDVPGRQHRVTVASLPAPFDSPLATNRPKLVARPPDAQLSVPPGFQVGVFASQLMGPRKMLVAANGDIFVSEPVGSRISVLHPSQDGATAASQEVYAQGLKQPFGLAFYPNARHPRWLYVAETNRVVRFAFKTGDVKAQRDPEVVVAELPSGGGHYTRDVAFSPDGRRMFVSVGSASNVAEKMSKKSPPDVKSWEAQHGLGAAWDLETNRAAVLIFNVGSKKPAKIFAAGIRNCVSLTVQPHTGDLWCTTNERDMLGDDLVPDYSTRVSRGGFYGWPWYYMGDHEDPRLKGDRPDLRGKVLVPDVLYQAHSAPLNLTFYTATSGSSAFPPEYVGDAFATFHGSWNRGFRTGHKLVRVHMKDGVPTGDYEDFLTGFIVDDGNAWGRPVATTVLHDGSLLMSDDGANLIYRISYPH
jgi:glucose/arabinose dehydrogenase